MRSQDIQQATKTIINKYINDRIAEYENHNLKASELFVYWQSDFENFDTAAYKKTTEGTKRLRDVLRQRGVYIPKNRKAIADNLVASSKA